MSRGRAASILLAVVLVVFFLPAKLVIAGSTEDQIAEFIKRIYSDGEVQVTFAQLPQFARNARVVKSISFSKVPDAAGDGICLVSMEGRNGSDTNVYVPFKVQVKRVLYGLKHGVKKGDTIHLDDVTLKETFLQGAYSAYPAGVEDIVGKAAKKEMLPGEIITKQMLEEQVVVTKGEQVNMKVENQKLLVQSRGMALEKGKLGDFIRVKSASGREVVGRVTGSNSIAVEF
jgi:flagella basal body P-ring formation protein FlgA